MKRAFAFAAALSAAALILGAAIVVARPQWLPAPIRARLASAAGPSAPAEDAGLYCKEHGVPEKFCTLCHEALKQTLLLCKEHGNTPEDICTLCHPEVEKQHKIEMCPNGHKLPKHFCYQCGQGPSASANTPDDGWCAVHAKPEVLCAECKLDPKAHDPAKGGAFPCRQPLPRVRLASARLAEQVGIQTAVAVEEEHAHKLTANAETAYNANRYADVTPRVAGFLRDVRADLGMAVKQGDVLAVVDSAEVSSAKAQFLAAKASEELARITYDRTKPLAKEGVVARKGEVETLTALNQARAALLDARQRLRNFGFDDDELARIVREDDTSSNLDVVAPIDGVVVARHAVKGEPVEPTTQVFAVADVSTMWLWIDVYEADVHEVQAGQPITFTVSGGDSARFEGTLNWVGTEVNQQTRTTRVRAELSNADRRLRANQFGQVEIQVEEPHKAIVVPKSAVQRKDDVDVVFLPEKEGGVYRPQRVMTKPTDRRDVLEVAWGLEAGQRVVTKGAFLLKTEIMKGAIGAGCCE